MYEITYADVIREVTIKITLKLINELTDKTRITCNTGN